MPSLGSIGITKLDWGRKKLFVVIHPATGLKIKIWLAMRLFYLAGKLLNCPVEVRVCKRS